MHPTQWPERCCGAILFSLSCNPGCTCKVCRMTAKNDLHSIRLIDILLFGLERTFLRALCHVIGVGVMFPVSPGSNIASAEVTNDTHRKHDVT